MTLDLLRLSRINPRLSAYAQLYGQHDYNAHPVAPPGIQVLIHEKSNNRRSWAPHGVEGWYLGPAMEHYRCYRVIASKTGGERITDTIQFFPHDVPMPGSSSQDRAREAAIELTDALKNFKHASPLKDVSDAGVQALKDLAAIFHRSVNSQSPAEQQPANKITTRQIQKVAMLPQTSTPPRVEVIKKAPNIILDDTSPRVRNTVPDGAHNNTHVIPVESPRVEDKVATVKINKSPNWMQSPYPDTTPHVIPMEDEDWDKTQKYIHKYNTRSSPRYAFAARVLNQQRIKENFPIIEEHINHVIHPDTGLICRYNKLAAGLVPGQEAAIWKTGLANELGRLENGVGTRMKSGTNTIRYINRQQVPRGRK